MGNSLLRCEAANAHTLFVATMERLDEPSLRMVECLRSLQEEDSSQGFRLADALRPRNFSDNTHDHVYDLYRDDAEAAELLADALSIVLGDPDAQCQSLSDTTTPNQICTSTAALPGVVKPAVSQMQAWAGRKDWFALLLQQRLVDRTNFGGKCRVLLTPLRLTVYRAETVQTLQRFLLAAMEVVLIYEDLQRQLKFLGVEEQKLVYGNPLSDQQAYWQAM